MAEGAHLTSALGDEKPSIFEVVAQDSLLSTIRPALKHAVRVLAEYRPDKFSWMLRHYDEIFTSLDLLLQNYHLRKYCASFSEHFYSLKRVSGDQPTGKLCRTTFWKSLICIVILPYIKLKLDERFEDMLHKYNTQNGQRFSTLSRVFITMYPYLHTSWEGAILAYQTAYMFGKSPWHSPFIHLAGVTLTLDLEGESHQEGSLQRLPWQHMSLQEKLSYVIKQVLSVTAISLSTGLSVGVFFLQFLDWWYANDTQATSLTALPVPDPPQEEETSEVLSPTMCPICHRYRSNHTALAVSGYVFCYPCIYDHISQYGRCPVTHLPATVEHLIKIYITES